MTMTADAPVSAMLRDVTGGKWVNADTEVETGCGIVPFAYRERNYVHALQWGIGLELFLLSRDPWRHRALHRPPERRLVPQLPEADPAADGPRLPQRAAAARPTSKAIRSTVLLDDLDREYTLEEIAIVTRAGPARLLGLARQGPPRRGRGRRRHRLRRPARPRGDVRHCRATSSRAAAWSCATASCVEPVEGTLLRASAARTIRRSRRSSSGTRALQRRLPRATRCASRGCSSRRGGSG